MLQELLKSVQELFYYHIGIFCTLPRVLGHRSSLPFLLAGGMFPKATLGQAGPDIGTARQRFDFAFLMYY